MHVDGRIRRRRIAYAGTGLVLAASALFEVVKHGTGVWQLVVFGLAPDLAFLVGARRMKQRGRLSPWAVRLYNATPVRRAGGPGLADGMGERRSARGCSGVGSAYRRRAEPWIRSAGPGRFGAADPL